MSETTTEVKKVEVTVTLEQLYEEGITVQTGEEVTVIIVNPTKKISG